MVLHNDMWVDNIDGGPKPCPQHVYIYKESLYLDQGQFSLLQLAANTIRVPSPYLWYGIRYVMSLKLIHHFWRLILQCYSCVGDMYHSRHV